MKYRMFKDDTQLYDYFASVKMNTIQRETVTIELLDEKGRAMFVWTLLNAFPMKVTGTDLEAGAGEVALEELVLAHEGLTIGAG